METNQGAHYRIIVEKIGEESEEYKLPRDLTKEGGGIECDGFVILADLDKEAHQTVIHNMTRIGIANIMHANPAMLSAATLAKAMDEANEIERKAETARGLERLFEGMKNLKKDEE